MRYAKYKSTGIAWLPEVPEEWGLLRIKALFVQRKERNDPIKTKNILSLTAAQGVVPVSEKIGAGGNKPKEDLTQYDLAYPDDLVLNCMNVVAGSVGVSKYFGAISPVYYALRVRDRADVMFYNYIFQMTSFQRSLLPLGKGILMHESSTGKLNTVRLRISMNALGGVKLPAPNIEMQRSIVAYLDEKCGKVDQLVAAKEKETALLKELKQSMIAEAVTHGVRPMRRLVSSGIPWLPEIPEGWKVRRAKYLFRKEQRPVQAGDEIVTCFRDGEVTLRKNRRVSGFTEATDYSHYQHICAGDLVIHQMDAFAGSCGVSDSDGMGTPVLSVCTPKNDRLDVRYFAAVVRLMGLNGFIQSLYRGIRERSSDFRFETFAKQELPIPPLAEQREIVAHIEARAAKIDAAVMGLEREVAALREYKQRLIADVVTGQRKVA